MSNQITYITSIDNTMSGANAGFLRDLRYGINPNSSKQDVSILTHIPSEAFLRVIELASKEKHQFVVSDRAIPELRYLKDNPNITLVNLSSKKDKDFSPRGLVQTYMPVKKGVFISNNETVGNSLALNTDIAIEPFLRKNPIDAFILNDDLNINLLYRNIIPAFIFIDNNSYIYTGDELAKVIGNVKEILKVTYPGIKIDVFTVKDIQDGWNSLRESFVEFKDKVVKAMSINTKFYKEPMKFGEAFDLMMTGKIDITPININGWDINSFVTNTPGSVVDEANFWSAGNREAARKFGGSLEVLPYAMQTKGIYTEPFSPNWELMRAGWIDRKDQVVIKEITKDGFGDYILYFAIMEGGSNPAYSGPLWLMYDGGCIEQNKVITVIGGADESLPRKLSPNSYKLAQVTAAAYLANYNRDKHTVNTSSIIEGVDLLAVIDVTSSNSKEDVYGWIEQAVNDAGDSTRASFIIDAVDLAGLVIDGEDIVTLITNHLHEKYKPMGVTWAVIDLDDEVAQ